MRQQATKANTAQIEQHIRLQKAGMTGDWEQDHPFLAALIGVTVLAITIGGLTAAWIAQGAGL